MNITEFISPICELFKVTAWLIVFRYIIKSIYNEILRVSMESLDNHYQNKRYINKLEDKIIDLELKIADLEGKSWK